MSAAVEFLIPTPAAALAWLCVLLAAGWLVLDRLTLVFEDRRDLAEQQLEADQDQAIALTVAVEAVRPTEPTLVLEVPAQRVTNGEDLLGGDLR